MHWSTIFVFLTVGYVDAVWNDHDKILKSDRLNHALSLVEPQNLLLNYEENVLNDISKAKFNITCMKDLAALRNAFLKYEMWALQMFDASSKIPAGILEGNTVDLGMYDECIKIRNESLGRVIQGHHCMYSVSIIIGNFTFPLNPTLSVCVPETCDGEQVATFLNTTIGSIVTLENVKISVLSATCSAIDHEIWDLGFIICTSFMIVLVSFLFFCTLCDVGINHLKFNYPKKRVLKIMAEFSLLKSASSILSLEITKGTIPSIHGIRFLSIAWIVLGHELLVNALSTHVNRNDIVTWFLSWNSLTILLSTLAVDTFFVLSGFLMTYLFLKRIPEQKSFNIPLYYISRYLRLTPTVIGLILLEMFYVRKLGSGPLWDKSYTRLDTCNWWTSLLYLQNFVDKKSMCFGHTWYLAVDMQLFWISPIILYPLYKKPKIGLAILGSLFVISSVLLGLERTTTEISIIVDVLNGRAKGLDQDIFNNLYILPYYRAGPWLIGIFLGYVVLNYERKLGKMTVIIGWLVAIACMLFCYFGQRSFVEPDYVKNVAWERFFSIFYRSIWSIGIAWIILASIKGCGGPISSFLSWRIFLPLSRLTYCIYMLHQTLQMTSIARLRSPTYFSMFDIWHSFLSTLVISVMVAFIFSLLFESPIMILEKMLLKKKH